MTHFQMADSDDPYFLEEKNSPGKSYSNPVNPRSCVKWDRKRINPFYDDEHPLFFL